MSHDDNDREDTPSPYQARVEEKRNRLAERAAATRAAADRTRDTASEMADRIPFGQPILVGHHSERADRRYRDRIHRTMAKSVELAHRADDLERRAATYGTHGISSDDDQAVTKLRDKLARLEQLQNAMKRVNRTIRATAKHGPEAQIAALVALDLPDVDETAAARLLTPDFAGRIGYPRYQLTNNNATIRSVKDRIAKLEARAAAPVAEGGTTGDITWGEDRDLNRVWIRFPDKPDPDTRNTLKAAGFRWAPSLDRWQRHTSTAALYHARRIVEGTPQ